MSHAKNRFGDEIKKQMASSVGRKLVMGLSGVGLVVFTILHLAANLQLYLPDGVAFNRYANGMHSLGGLLYVLEAGLAAVFLVHIFFAIRVTFQNKSSRSNPYKVYKGKKGPSKGNVASRNMPITGIVLLGFLILHIWQFRLGPTIEEGYSTYLDGKEAWDVHRIVVETFQDPVWTFVYVVVMIFLGLHLRHGFWSAFQSLGVNNGRISAPLYCLAFVVGLLVAVGFLFIPLWIFFDIPGVYS